MRRSSFPPPNSRPGRPEILEMSLSHFLGGSTRASRESFRDHGLYPIKRKRSVHPYKKVKNSSDFFENRCNQDISYCTSV